MKLKLSPCFWCGGPSTVRAEGEDNKGFNSCDPHSGHLHMHAQRLFHVSYVWLTATDIREYTWNSEREAFVLA